MNCVLALLISATTITESPDLDVVSPAEREIAVRVRDAWSDYDSLRRRTEINFEVKLRHADDGRDTQPAMRIVGVTFRNGTLRPGCLKQLSALKHLERISIFCSRLPESGEFEHLATLPRLATFAIFSQNEKPLDGELRHLARAPSLRTVVLEECGLTQGAVGHLSQLKQIKSLVLRKGGTEEQSTDLSPLAGLVGLDTLYLADFGDKSRPRYAWLGQLAQLRRLALIGTSVSEASIEAIGAIRTIEALRLRSADQISEDGLRAIAALPRLEYLDLVGTTVEDEALGHLADSTSLSALEVNIKYRSDAEVMSLARIRNLNSLAVMDRPSDSVSRFGDLRGVKSVKLSVMDVPGDLLRQMPRDLESLCLEYCDDLTEDGWNELGKLENLKCLTLRNQALPTKAFRQFLKNRKLHTLVIEETLINSRALSVLQEAAAIHELEILGPTLSDAALEHLAGIRSLQKCSVWLTNSSRAAERDFFMRVPGAIRPLDSVPIDHLFQFGGRTRIYALVNYYEDNLYP